MSANLVTAGVKITQSTDIANLIATINAETTRRGASGGALTATAQGSKAVASIMLSAIAQNATINAVHTYATGIQTHSGGVSKTPTASTANFVGGSSKMTAAAYNQVAADINTLASQSQCTQGHTYSCTLNCTCNTQCSCNVNVPCSCNNVCTANCAGNTYCCNAQAGYHIACTCNNVCTYNSSTYCCNAQSTCGCQSGNCTSNCTGNTYACSCNAQCSCEYV